MNRQELRSQVMRRLSVGRTFSDAIKVEIAHVMDQLLEPYEERDRKAAEQKQAPYSFEPRAVIWLERLVRQRLKI